MKKIETVGEAANVASGPSKSPTRDGPLSGMENLIHARIRYLGNGRVAFLAEINKTTMLSGMWSLSVSYRQPYCPEIKIKSSVLFDCLASGMARLQETLGLYAAEIWESSDALFSMDMFLEFGTHRLVLWVICTS